MLLALAWAPQFARAQAPLRLEPAPHGQPLGRHLGLLEDPDGNLTIEQVASPQRAADFRPAQADRLSLGYSGAAFWFRLEVDNPTAQPVTWVLELAYEMLGDVRLYLPGPDGTWRLLQAGVEHPVNPDLIPARTPVFPITSAPGRSTLFMRVRTTSPMTLPLQAHTRAGYNAKAERDLVVLWMFYGLMLGMLLFNLLVFAFTRDWTFATYALNITGGTAFLLVHNGLAYRYLWPGAQVQSGQALILSGFVWALGICLFTRSFLDTRRTSPRVDAALRFTIWGCLVGTVAALFVYSRVIEMLGGLILIGLTSGLLITSAQLLRKGIRAARFYMLACTALIIGVLSGLLEAVGVLGFNSWTAWGYQVGFALQALLLSLALADRYNQLRRAAVEANEALEDKVRARTEKLQAATLELLHRAEELEVVNRLLNEEMVEREQSEQARRELTDQLRQTQKLDALGRLAGGVAHDMNNLLASILGFGELLKEGLTPASELRDDVEQILAAARRGGQLTRNLLGFARRGAYEKGPVALNELVRQVERLLEPSALRRVEIALDLDPDLPQIEGDADLLSHAITNLGLNGIQAIDGKGHLTLKTRSVVVQGQTPDLDLPAGRYAQLTVADDGCGMEPAQLEQAFEPFYTTKPKGQGTGLGLGMVYGTIRQHGGAVTLESQPGQGTRARIWLPAIEAMAAETAKPRSQPPGEGVATTGLSGTVLVVDDEDSILEISQRLLGEVGLQVLVARDGAEALQVLKAEDEVDLVMLDMVMPVMDGPATFDQLAKRWPGVPVLLCTGFADQAVSDRLLQQGAVGLLLKPFDKQALLQAVARALAGETASGQAASTPRS